MDEQNHNQTQQLADEPDANDVLKDLIRFICTSLRTPHPAAEKSHLTEAPRHETIQSCFEAVIVSMVSSQPQCLSTMDWARCVPSFAQKVHAALEACTKLLRYSNLSALELVTDLFDLTVEMFSLFNEISEVLEVRTLRSFPADYRLVNINTS
jgi:hypothetical protein